ncbi:uncharacterized protein [Aegilops tauschii subsp. strangulata]|uniref:uncharacterized protein n=1 Tax=Aegilops tauschii subsp. strangulata TaxID=200361 RepID=UPI003CC874F4
MWWLTGVYGPQGNAEKVAFLQELEDIRDLHAGPWVLVGDFNLIVNAEDKNNANVNRRMLARFRATLNRLELKELYLNGRRYTWSNERLNPTLDKIDHVFATNTWEDIYPANLLTALGTSISYHCPLLVDLDAEFHVGRRFRFEGFWTKVDGFHEVVQQAWHSVPADGNPFWVLDSKLRAMAKALQSWSDRRIGNIKLQLAMAMELIARLDAAADKRSLTIIEHDLRKLLNKKLLGLCSLERTIARQRSRLLFLKEGDANTGFFHKHAAYRQRKNAILSLQQQGEIISGQDNISAAVDTYYDNLLGDSQARTASINLDLLDLPSYDLSHLEVQFTVEEVEKVIMAIPLDKAPGPDGFTGRFYASCWQIVKADFMRALDQFHQGDMRGLAPTELESRTCGAILDLFGHALGLSVNMSKSAAIPIHCSQEEVSLVCSILGCSSNTFPCTYLGLPLTLRKQSAAQLQSLVDRLADCLPHWKAAMLPKSGRLTLILSVLCAISIHSMLAMNIPVKIIKALSKICRGFLWCGKKEEARGHCAVAWDSEDRWISGYRICELAPAIYSRVRRRTRASRTVADALTNEEWARDIGPNLLANEMAQFLALWQRVTDTQLVEGEDDRTTWSWEQNRNFSARSAYAANFMGLQRSPTVDFTWKSSAPLHCCFFLWLAIQNRCWTSDRLAKRGLPHQDACPFCDQHEESIQHLLLGCVFARPVWHEMGMRTGLHELEPLQDESLSAWCLRQDQHPVHRRSLRAKCILALWTIWKHRNDIVFNGASVSLSQVKERLKDEGNLWAKAGLFKGDTRGFDEHGSRQTDRE